MLHLRRLNLDNSWLLTFDGTSILIDPWLVGEETDYFRWFNTQWHRTKPVDPKDVPDYDFVLITQKYPDHFHKATLRILEPGKVIVPKSVEKACRKLLPNAEVINFNQGLKPIPGTTVNLHFLPTSRRLDPIYDALLLENKQKSVFLASHGFTLSDKQQAMVKKLPPVDLLITPFNLYKLPSFLGGIVSPGLERVQALVECLDPKAVVATHDEDKFARGLVSRFARIKRAPHPKELMRKEFLANRYIHIDHYEQVDI
jgi:L-ascorbate metabolism protein UlaG (beta-lactamase superfamily)